MRDISTTVPKRAAARKFPHHITPDEVGAISAAVAKMPGDYVVSEGQTRRAMVIVAAPTLGTQDDELAHNPDEDFPTISFRRLFSAEFSKRPEIMVSVCWPGGTGPDELPLLRTLDGALSILPVLAAQWVRL